MSSDLPRATPKQLVHRLLAEAIRIAVDEKVAIEDLYDALMVIPEFAAALGKDAPWPYAA